MRVLQQFSCNSVHQVGEITSIYPSNMQAFTIVLRGLIHMTRDSQRQRINRADIINTACLKEYRNRREILNYTRFAERLEGIEDTSMGFIIAKN